MKAFTHCQICGRAIKMRDSAIALHGYKRPYAYTQTSSCEGAQELPYELSCELLKQVLVSTEEYLIKMEKYQVQFDTTPPQKLTVSETRSAYRLPEPITYEKPDDFTQGGYSKYIPNTYGQAYESEKYKIASTIRLIKIHIADMKQRIADWKLVDLPAQEREAVKAASTPKAAKPEKPTFTYRVNCPDVPEEDTMEIEAHRPTDAEDIYRKARIAFHTEAGTKYEGTYSERAKKIRTV